MKHLIASAALSLGACATVAPVAPLTSVERPSDSPGIGFNRVEVRSDLIASARERYGEAALQRALAADTHLIAKYYPGMMPPPPEGAPPDWHPPFPVAILFKENGQWMTASAMGFRPSNSEKAAAIEATLANRAFWAEPSPGPVGCTDSGGAFFLLKAPGKAEIVRRGVCGGSPIGESLVFDAINS